MRLQNWQSGVEQMHDSDALVEVGKLIVIARGIIGRRAMRSLIDGLNTIAKGETVDIWRQDQPREPSAMTVIEHRPVLKRIDIGQRGEVDRRRDITEALSGISPTERDRIWKHVVQASHDGLGAPVEAGDAYDGA